MTQGIHHSQQKLEHYTRTLHVGVFINFKPENKRPDTDMVRQEKDNYPVVSWPRSRAGHRFFVRRIGNKKFYCVVIRYATL